MVERLDLDPELPLDFGVGRFVHLQRQREGIEWTRKGSEWTRKGIEWTRKGSEWTRKGSEWTRKGSGRTRTGCVGCFVHRRLVLDVLGAVGVLERCGW